MRMKRVIVGLAVVGASLAVAAPQVAGAGSGKAGSRHRQKHNKNKGVVECVAQRPAVTLTPKQEFFAGSHLNGIRLIESRQGCGIDLRWEDPLDTGARHLGP